MKDFHVTCQCSNIAHTLHFSYDVDDNVLYMGVHLNPYLPWYKRCYQAVRYALGLKPTQDHFDGTMLTAEGAIEFQKYLAKMIEKQANIEFT